MSKLIVLLMDENYPFIADISTQDPYNILVRQSIHTATPTKNTTLSKANFIKNLKNKYLVKVDSLLQQEQTIHIMYEYVESKLENVLKDASTLLINKINAQLNQFGRYLSNIGVRTLFHIDRIGVNGKDNLKYFMGLDFQWEEDPDEEFLEQFYEKQIQDIMGQHVKRRQLVLAQNRKQSVFSLTKQQQNLAKRRKISQSTLPNRYTRYHKIDQKLKQIKSSTKLHEHNNNDKKTSSVDTTKYTSNLLRKQPGFPKKVENRKYSSDIKYEFESKDRLSEKQSDIQSEYWQRKKKVINGPKTYDGELKSEADTNKTKSRTEQMKQKQYRQISNLKKDYLKDFISVLEQQQQGGVLPLNSNRNTENKTQENIYVKKTQSFIDEDETSTDQLQIMAKEAIQNSWRVITKFKNVIRGS